MYLMPNNVNYLNLDKAKNEVIAYIEKNDWKKETCNIIPANEPSRMPSGIVPRDNPIELIVDDVNLHDADNYSFTIDAIKYLRKLEGLDHINEWLDTFIVPIGFVHLYRMAPGFHLSMHVDNYDRAVRLLYPLFSENPHEIFLDYHEYDKGTPILEKRLHYYEGLPFIFDASKLHSATNNSDTYRIIIQIQFHDSDYEEYCKLAQQGKLCQNI